MRSAVEMRSAAEQWVERLSKQDWAGMETLLAEDVAFNMLLPHPLGLRACTGPGATVDYFKGWFSDVEVTRLQTTPPGKPYPSMKTTKLELQRSMIGEPIADRVPVQYLLLLNCSRGVCDCEHVGYFQVDKVTGKILALDLACIGIIPRGE